jgi:hypothetical protein
MFYIRTKEWAERPSFNPLGITERSLQIKPNFKLDRIIPCGTGPSRPFQTKTNEHIFHRSALRMDGRLKRREILTDRAHNGRQLKKIIY